jgi:hypothetical protein
MFIFKSIRLMPKIYSIILIFFDYKDGNSSLKGIKTYLTKILCLSLM